MPTRFSTAVNTALARLEGSAGEPCVYTRGSTSLTVMVVWGRSAVEELSPQVSATLIERSDAILSDYADLIAAFGVPQPRDEIAAADGRRFQVLPAGDGLACWRWMGTRQEALRIHTLLMEAP